MTEALWLALAAAVGAGGRELIGRLIPTRSEAKDAQLRFTEQVVKRVDSLDQQVTTIRREADQWRERFFAAQTEIGQLRIEVGRLEGQVAHLTEQLKRSPS